MIMTDDIDNSMQADETSPNDENKTNQNAAQNEEQSANKIEPMTSEELFTRALLLLQVSAQQDDKVAAYYTDLKREYFGPEISDEEAENAPFEDKRQQDLVERYISDKIEIINDYAISLKQSSVNKAFEEIFILTGMELNAESIKPDFYDSLFEYRASMQKGLLEEYKILQLNRDVLNIYKNKSGTIELNDKVMKMENYFSSGAITREQLAQFYYNIGSVYDISSLQKNTEKMVKDEHNFALGYKRQALDITNTNIALILDVHRDWSPHFDYNSQKILDACHRVIDNSGDARSLFRAHKLYAETLLDFKGTDGFSKQREKRINSVIKHFRRAINYTNNKNEKIDLLNIVSEQEKNFDKSAYIRTRMEMASLLNYRARIREYNRLVDETDNIKLKRFMLKAGINEFYELSDIDNEDRHLYDSLDAKFRNILNNENRDEKTIAKLDKLKKIYGSNPKDTKEIVFTPMSTSGHDWFASDR
ncbi:MAG: hypothetical protein IJS88_01465 [Alphaproteobacteria bacterium]|nr:hypothetical protein [Alphaproteobacteria bacterium]